MGQSSSVPEKSALRTNPVNVDITTQKGSAAEQDRFGQHFSGTASEAGERIKDGFKDFRSSVSGQSGAEQDRYAARFEGVGQAAYEKGREGFEKAKDAAERGYDKARYEAERAYGKAKDSAERGYDKTKEAGNRALHAKGDGAEQDRYGMHFSYGSLEFDPVRKAALSILSKGGNFSAASRHGLGYDGWERAKILAAHKGDGAEQDRYGSYFGGVGERAADAIKAEYNKLQR